MSTDAGFLNARWLPALDDSPPESIRYHVYIGDPATLLVRADAMEEADRVLTGEESVTVSELVPGTSVGVLVVAEDEEGQRSEPGQPLSAQIASTPLEIRSPVVDMSDLEVRVVSSNTVLVDLDNAPSTGELLLLDIPGERMLRRVVGARETEEGVELETARASLSEAISTGELSTTVRLPALPDVGGAPGALTASPNTYKRTITNRDGSFELVEEGVRRANLGREVPPVGQVSLSQSVTLDHEASFEPSFEVKARWSDPEASQPDSLRAVAKGKFTLKAEAAFELDGSASFKKETELFARKLSFTYAIGPVPVYQEVELKLMAALEMEAEAGFEARAEFEATKEVVVGFTWDKDRGFGLVREDGFEQKVEFTLEGEATASATLRIYPVISTTLYKLATAALTVEPSLEAKAAARFIPTPVELTKFNLDFYARAYAQADLSIFGLNLAKWKSDKVELLRVPLFSLPELKIRTGAQFTTCRPGLLVLAVTDGYNNKIQPESIAWSVEGADIEVTEPERILARLAADGPGTYTVSASAFGDGFLGRLGTRRASVEVNVVEVDCDELEPEPGETPSGATTLRCDPFTPALGLTGPMVFARNRIAVGEDYEVRAPVFIDERSRFLRGGIANTSDNPNYLLDYAVANPLDGPVLVAPGERDILLRNRISTPGRFSPFLDLRNEQSCTAFPEFYHCISYGEGRDGRFFVAEQSNEIEPDGVCNRSLGLPLPVLEVVGPMSIVPDDNDSPESAQRVVPGRRYVQAVGGEQDEADYFLYEPVPTVPGFEDTDADPSCPLYLSATDEFGTPVFSIQVFEGIEATEPIADGRGEVILESVRDPLVIRLASPFRVEQAGLDIQARCGEPLPAMTDTPLAPSVHQIGEDLRIEVPVNTDTARVQVEMVGTRGFPEGRGSADRVDQSDTVEVSFEVEPFRSPAAYVVQVIVEDASGEHSGTYTLDAERSETFYTLVRNGISYPTEIPLVWVDYVD